jgi:putative SOS response-associated peptidase YedK
MFNRYALFNDLAEIIAEFNIQKNRITQYPFCYNVGVGSAMPIIIAGVNRERELVEATWNGDWIQPGTMASSLTSDDIRKVPQLQKSFQRRRCLVIMNGYFDWKHITDTIQIPFYFRILSSDLFGVAGLYEKVDDTYRFIPIETRANEIVEPLSATMPAILTTEVFDMWLDPLYPDMELLHELLAPVETIEMSSYRVSLKESDRASNTKELIHPIL